MEKEKEERAHFPPERSALFCVCVAADSEISALMWVHSVDGGVQ